MRRAALLVLPLLLAACSDGGGGADTTPPAVTSQPAPAPATETTEPELPVLEDLTAPDWTPTTRSEELAVELDSPDPITLQQAVDAIGLVAQDMPGTTPTDLPPGDGLGDTYTLNLAARVRDQLSPAQRQVVDDYLEPGQLVGRVTADGQVIPAGSGEETTTTTSITSITPSSEGFRAPGAPPDVIDFDYLNLAYEVLAKWDSHLPDHPEMEIELRFRQGSSASGMDARLKDGDPHTCLIRVFNSFYQGNPSTDLIRFFFAHEEFHCFQQRWGSGAMPWIEEGSADWAAADLFRGATLNDDGLGDQWFTLPDVPLAARQYSAWPFFELVRATRGDAYPVIIHMFQSPHSSVDQVLQEESLSGELFRMEWSSHTLRSTAFGDPWRFAWPTPNSDFGPHDNLYPMGPRGTGFYNILGKGHFTQMQYGVSMHSDVGLVRVTPYGGPLTTETADGAVTVGEGATEFFCFDPAKCECPEDQKSGAHQMLGNQMIFSFAASLYGSTAAVRAEPWDPERCEDPDDSRDRAESNGDPHLVTFDGLPFDMITLGEIVVARDPAGDFEVQTRNEAFHEGAGTTAVAIGTGDGHRLTFTMDGFDATGPPVVRVDGLIVEGASVEVGSARAALDDVVPAIVWADGSTVELHWFHGWFVALDVTHERAARMDGILGSRNHDISDDLRLADGTFSDTSDLARDEAPLALQWMVDTSTTLFDYDPGQSPATFRIPHPNPTPPEIDSTTEDLCEASLGDQATSYEVDACAYDVTVTGEPGFVETYAEVVDRRVESDPDIVIVPSTTTSPEPTGPGASGEAGTPVLRLGGDQLTGSVDARAGAVLVARMELCPDVQVDLIVSLAGDSGTLARATVCDPAGLPGIGGRPGDEWFNGESYVWLPGDGQYELEVETIGFGQGVGAIDFYLDDTPTVLNDGDLAGGDQRTLSGIGDTVVYLTDPRATYTATGFDTACAVEVYWSYEFPDTHPFNLTRCGHPDGIDFPPTDQVIPVVVFARTNDPVQIEFTPTG